MKILIIDPLPKGHQNFYLSLILRSFQGCEIDLLTAEGNDELKDHLARRVDYGNTFRILRPVQTKALPVLRQASDLVIKGGHDLAFIPYLDSFLEPLFRFFSNFPCPVAGIWFHPYALDRKYSWLPPLDKRLKYRRLIHQAFKKKSHGIIFSHIHFLHTDCVKQLRRLDSNIPSSVLVDPWERLPSLNMRDARVRFSLPLNKKIFLHIGSIEKRKGLSETIRAFELLAKNTEVNKEILLLRVGPTANLCREDLEKFDALQLAGLAKIIPQRASEEDFMEYFAASDCILIPYRKFRFSSGILSNAIAAGKPIIGTKGGLLGKTITSENLGLIIPSLSPNHLAKAVIAFLLQNFSAGINPDSISKRNPSNFSVNKSLDIN